MLMRGGSQLIELVIDRTDPGWATVAADCYFEPGRHLLVAVHRADSSLVIDARPTNVVSLADVVGRVIRDDGTLPMGQFDRLELRATDPDGHAGRWHLTVHASGQPALVASLTLLSDVGCAFIEDLEIGYCEHHMHEDRDEVEEGLAACLSRGGAAIAGLSAEDLALLEEEELDLLPTVIFGG